MKQFISKISVFFGIFVLICILGHYLTRQPESGDPNDFLAAIIDKHQRLESFSTPVTIFAGGSNLAYGLDSDMLTQELQSPVVNLALHAGLGFHAKNASAS